MNRRRYLGATAGLLIPLTGCLTGESSTASSNGTTDAPTSADGIRTTDSEPSPPIADHQFRVLEYDHEYSGPTFSSVDGCNHAAEVRFQAASNRIVVEGWMGSGSRSCRTTILDTVTYDAETRSLQLTILDTFEEGSGGCSTEIDPVTYEAIITFDSNLPEIVLITHRDELQDDDTYNETFHNEAATPRRTSEATETNSTPMASPRTVTLTSVDSAPNDVLSVELVESEVTPNHPVQLRVTLTNTTEQARMFETGHSRVFSGTFSESGDPQLLLVPPSYAPEAASPGCWRVATEPFVVDSELTRMQLAPGEDESITLSLWGAPSNSGACLPPGTDQFSQRYRTWPVDADDSQQFTWGFVLTVGTAD